MIVDASAIVALVLDEPNAGRLARRLQDAQRAWTHPASVYEAVLAVARASRRSLDEADEDVRDLMAEARLDVATLGPPETEAAVEAFSRYGKGRHPAALNMGDCFSHAYAKLRGVRLLYKGDDFARTDLA